MGIELKDVFVMVGGICAVAMAAPGLAWLMLKDKIDGADIEEILAEGTPDMSGGPGPEHPAPVV